MLSQLPNNSNLKGKRVLIRIDANVPIVSGKAVDGPNGRIARSALDINWLSHRGARVIVVCHLGRPNGRRVSSLSVAPVVKRLSSLLGGRVKLSRSIVGATALKAVKAMKDGDVLVLENIRFDKRETANDATLAKALAELADLYVNDAFGVCHRTHTSVHALAKELPAYVGPLLEKEIAILGRVDSHIKHPFVLVMGGVKLETKLSVMERFASEVDSILLGGALATAVLSARGIDVGASFHDREGVRLARTFSKVLEKKIVLPTDVVVASSLRRDARAMVKSVEDVHGKDRIVDIGPETITRYESILQKAKTIVWNGPIGYCEMERFCHGTHAIASVIAKRTGKATTIVGGGDTMPILERIHLADKFTLLSTGGGAMLEFLARGTLPCVEVLSYVRKVAK